MSMESAHLMSVASVPVPQERIHHSPNLASLEEYHKLHKESVENPSEFFGKMARKFLSWDRDFTHVQANRKFEADGLPNAWFLNGQLNASYNCVDRHAFENPDKVAIVYEADEPGQGYNITYGELLQKVSQLAQLLTSLGVQKGDTVAIYLPMIPEVVVAMLAVTRIGAVHSIVFAGFSSNSLRERINNASSKVVITADESRRGGKVIETKKIVDEALKDAPSITNCIVLNRIDNPAPLTPGRDLWWHEAVTRFSPYSPPVPVNSEDPLFLLYTSGSTGTPKGIQHTVAGYLLGAAMTCHYTFDLHKEDVLFTAGDAGWITGHTYAVYGPLLCGATTVIFEGTPTHPSPSRYWEIVDQHKATQFYVAPTALRLLKRAGDEHIKPYSLSSLRVLGSVGEPIAAEVWDWYNEVIGRGKVSIVDTYWQTESGSHLLTPMATVTPMKPGSATLPMFGIDPVILDPVTGKELEGVAEGVLAIRQTWPSFTRTIFGAHERFHETYFKPYPGYYFTGDGAARDQDGYFWILGRVDDVVNVSGHRLSTAEIEGALLECKELVSECGVVGVPDEIRGMGVAAFVVLKNGVEPSEDVKKKLIMTVRSDIGPFAAPQMIIAVDDLPKTRSGKIMRRILRKILAGEEGSLGDVSTLSNPGVVTDLIQVVHAMRA